MRSGLRAILYSLPLCLALGAAPATAAALGPDAFGYQAQSATGTRFEDVSASGTRVLENVDDASIEAPIGFSFPFYGSTRTSVFINSNGLLTFGAAPAGVFPGFDNRDLATNGPSPDVPAIAPLWDDWVTNRTGDDAVYYQTLGSPGSRRFVVQWHMVFGFSFTGSPSDVTFQAVLFEGSGAILFRFLDVDSGDPRAFGGLATVGIRDAGGHLNGRFVQWSFNAPVIASGDAILFVNAGSLSAGRVVAAGSFADGAGLLQLSARAGAPGSPAGAAAFRLPPGIQVRSTRITGILLVDDIVLVTGQGWLGKGLVPFSIQLLPSPAGNRFRICIGGAFPVDSGLLTLQRGGIRVFP